MYMWAAKCTKLAIQFAKQRNMFAAKGSHVMDRYNSINGIYINNLKSTNLVDNVSQLSAVREYVLAGGVSTVLEKLIP